MDPVEQLRLLRDDSRWIEEELDFDAYAAPARRRWSRPRIAGFSVAVVAVAAAAALVIAGVHGSWNAAPVPAGPVPTPTDSPAVLLPACEPGQFNFGVTPFAPKQKPDGFVRAGWLTATNTSNVSCRLDGDNEPTIQVAKSDGAILGGDTFSSTGGARDLVVDSGDSVAIPFVIMSPAATTGVCRESADGFVLNLPGWTPAPYVRSETIYCGEPPQISNWPAASAADPVAMEQDISNTAYQPPTSDEPVSGQCTTDELSAALAPDRSSDQGTDWAIITVTNTGKRSCEIGPVASVGWVHDSTHAGGVAASTGSTQNSPAVIGPGESAGVIIGFIQAVQQDPRCDAQGFTTLRLALNDGKDGLSPIAGGADLQVDVGALGIKACDGDVQQLKVFGPRAGASLHD